MSSFIPPDISDLLKKMRCVSSLGEGDRLDFPSWTVNHGTLLERISRSLRGDSRMQMCDKMLELTQRVCAAIEDKKGNLFYDEIVDEARRCIVSLRCIKETTYADDVAVCSDLENCISSLTKALRDLPAS
jgi:hypothetical protein